MACCAQCGSSTGTCGCKGFTVLEGAAVKHTLAASLVGVVDQARDIASCLGLRPYQISLIWTRWAGGSRGQGVEELVRREMILPTPLVSDLTALNQMLQTVGTMEQGGLSISEISARYTEDFLMGRDAAGRSIPPDQSFFWEVYFPQASGSGIRRRFTPSSAPTLHATKLEWTISLKRAFEDRTRLGSLR